MKEHRDRIEKMNGSNLKFGEDLKVNLDICNFCFIVLETFDDYTVTEAFLREREAFYIKKYDAYNGYNDEYRTPSLSGYFSNKELLFCKKYRNQKVNKSDLEMMSDEQLLENYKISVCKSKKTNQIELFETEILRRIKNKH